MESSEELVMRLERELLEPSVRANRARLDSLLTDDFHKVGSRGWSFGKPEVLTRLPDETGIAFRASSMEAHTLATGVILVTYTAERTHDGVTTRSLRSSIWIQNGDDWRMRYHQGTAAA